MAVLQFITPSQIPMDWAQQELAELYRVEASLVQSGVSVETERGVTDEGDPWFVFCRPETGDVIIHFAKCDGLYVAVGSFLAGTLRGSSFVDLVKQFIDSQPISLPRRDTRSSPKLFMHPSAMLMALVATGLFSYDNSEVTKGDIIVEREGLDKSDALTARVYNAIKATYNETRVAVSDFATSTYNAVPAALLAAMMAIEEYNMVDEAETEKALLQTIDDGNNVQPSIVVTESNSTNTALSAETIFDIGDSFEGSLSLDNANVDNSVPDTLVISATVALVDMDFTPLELTISSVKTQEEPINLVILEDQIKSEAVVLTASEEAVVFNATPVLDNDNNTVMIEEREIISYSFGSADINNKAFLVVNEAIEPEAVIYVAQDDGDSIGTIIGNVDNIIDTSSPPSLYNTSADMFVRSFMAEAENLEVLLFGSDLILIDRLGANEEYSSSVFSWDFDDGSTISVIGNVSEDLMNLIA